MENIKETAQQEETRTFTQEEVDRIVGERLGREREKYANFEEYKQKALKFDEREEADKTELQKATERADALQIELDGMKKAEEVRTMRAEVSKATGVPIELLTGDSSEACTAQAENILKFAKPSAYPTVKDGGEPNKPPTTEKTRDQFADFLNKSLKR